MRRARAFFFVCAGTFLLVLSFHLGAGQAVGQSGAWRVLGDALVESGGSIYMMSMANGWVPANTSYWGSPIPVPASEILAAWSDGVGATTGYVEGFVTTSGEGWRADDSGWHGYGMVPGAPTSAQTMSMGQLKAKYVTPTPTK